MSVCQEGQGSRPWGSWGGGGWPCGAAVGRGRQQAAQDGCGPALHSMLPLPGAWQGDRHPGKVPVCSEKEAGMLWALGLSVARGTLQLSQACSVHAVTPGFATYCHLFLQRAGK